MNEPEESTTENKIPSVLTGFISVLFGDVGRLLTFALFIPLLVRMIGESGYGTYALVMAIFAPTRVATNAGLFEATKTFLSQENNQAETQKIVSTSLTLQVLFALAGGAVLVGVGALAPLDPVVYRSLLIVVVALIGEQLFKFGRAVLHARHEESTVEPLIFVRSIILAVVGLILASGPLGVSGVFVGFATGFGVAGIVVSWYVLRRVSRISVGHIDRTWAVRLARFGFPSMLLVLMITGLYKVDIVIVDWFGTKTDAGHYRAALQIAEFVWIISISVRLVMIQSTAELWSRGDLSKVTEITARSVRYVIAGTTLILVGVGTLGDQLIKLYFGSGFGPAVLPLLVLLPGVAGFAVARVVWPVLQAGGYLRHILVAAGVSFFMNIVANLLLVPQFGIVGAAVATSFSYVLLGVNLVIVARSIGVNPLAEVRFAAVVVVIVSTAAVTIGVNAFVPGYWALIVVPPAGFITFLGTSLALGFLSTREIRTIYQQHL